MFKGEKVGRRVEETYTSKEERLKKRGARSDNSLVQESILWLVSTICCLTCFSRLVIALPGLRWSAVALCLIYTVYSILQLQETSGGTRTEEAIYGQRWGVSRYSLIFSAFICGCVAENCPCGGVGVVAAVGRWRAQVVASRHAAWVPIRATVQSSDTPSAIDTTSTTPSFSSSTYLLV